MPKPKEDETQDEFIDRCIPQVIEEGKTQEQAIGKCFGIWQNENS